MRSSIEPAVGKLHPTAGHIHRIGQFNIGLFTDVNYSAAMGMVFYVIGDLIISAVSASVLGKLASSILEGQAVCIASYGGRLSLTVSRKSFCVLPCFSRRLCRVSVYFPVFQEDCVEFVVTI